MINNAYYKNIHLFFTAVIIAIIAGGFYFSDVAGKKTTETLKANLLNRTKVLSSLIDCNEIKTLKGSNEDLSSEVYLTYKRLFFKNCNSQDDIRYTYMMGIKNDRIFFFADSEPDSKADPTKPLAMPGETYEDPPQGLREVFVKGLDNYTVGPYTDRWGTFFSAMLPVFDLNGKDVVCVIGMDMDAYDWDYQVFKSKLSVWILAFTLIIALFAVNLNIKNQIGKNIKIQKKLNYQQAALKLAKQDNSDFKKTLERIAKSAAETVAISRASIWRFNENFSELICEAQYDSQSGDFKSGGSLMALEYPDYFKALNAGRQIAAAAAREDEKTRCLSEYLISENIFSILDTMIWLHGRPAGVLCLEQTKTFKYWQEEDSDFALTISDLLSLVFEARERVQAEKDLQDSKEYLEKIINSVADPIFVKDSVHRFILVNNAFAKLLNKNYYEIVGKKDSDFFPPDQVMVFETVDDLVLETGGPNINEEQLTDASGKLRNIITKKTLYTDNEGRRYVVGVIRDITERKKMDEERAKMSKIESIGILAGGIAHDFNNILMGILGNISLAKNRCIKDQKTHEVLGRAEAVVHKARGLTEQLITFSKGGMPIKKLCALNEIVKNTSQFTLSGSKIKPFFNLDATMDMVRIDDGQFSQVIANIIINARQATDDKGEIYIATQNVTTHSDTEFPHRTGSYVKLSIQDNGPGIKRENFAKIFDPYFTTKPTGSGLGLFTSYSIVNKHGGYMRAISNPGEGALFEIYLPAASQTEDKPESLQIATTSAGKLYNILVMDDEIDTLAPICDMLSENGNVVTLVENGEAALKLYDEKMKKGQKFDLVIVDLVIRNGLGGMEFIKKLLELDPRARAIISSGRADDKLMTDYRQYGFYGAIAKPYKAEELNELIAGVFTEIKC
ncbi:MAG TPA: ATP-binding protein [Candidatus Wallbacteria bacterium]|nr:ATP-binding protein [Candidatus Wallbacteria bacterium]